MEETEEAEVPGSFEYRDVESESEAELPGPFEYEFKKTREDKGKMREISPRGISPEKKYLIKTEEGREDLPGETVEIEMVSDAKYYERQRLTKDRV